MGEPFYHDVILQKLGVYHVNNGRSVYYSPESFSASAELWDGIPVIFAPSFEGANITHPDFDAVSAGNIPEGYQICGRVSYAHIPYEGEQRLCASLLLNNAEVEQLARDGKLALSTGFRATSLEIAENTDRITGTITPNHVLVFEKGACSSCWSNDDGAMFLNTKREADHKMTEPTDNETKGLLAQILNSIQAIGKKHEAAPEGKPMGNTTEPDNTKPDNAKLEQIIAENTTLKAELAKRDAEEARRTKDQLWNNAKATLGIPPGWLGDKEPETRAQFENQKDAFYARLVKHVQTPHANSAEGCGCPQSSEAEKAVRMANLKKLEAESQLPMLED